MKDFFKTVAGKTLLFLSCTISVILCIVSLAGILFYAEEDFYINDQKTLEERYISSKIVNDLYSEVYEAALGGSEEMIVKQDIGNLVFRIRKEKEDETVSCSESAQNVDAWTYSFRFIGIYDKQGDLSEIYRSDFDPVTEEEGSADSEAFLADAYIRKGTGISDFYSLESGFFDTIYKLRYAVFYILAVSVLILIISFISLMCVSGRRKQEGLFPGPLHKIPFDLLVAVWIAILFIGILLIGEVFRFDLMQLLFALILGVFFIASFIGLCMSFAVRIKAKDLISTSFTYRFLEKTILVLRMILKLIGRLLSGLTELIKAIPLSWKVLSVFTLISLAELVFFENRAEWMWLLTKTVLFLALTYLCLCMHKLLKSGENLAGGDLSYHVDTGKMILDLKRHGDDLNSIASGMAIAVDERMKSERMKTELITNVSHDIKTPLTSIINYADLIAKQEDVSDTVKEYTDVLVRQSKRLKRLLEDLVEASKAASGSLEVELSPCDASIFIDQCVGEYEERLKQNDLTLIAVKPQERVEILADPRRMQRVFDNLMNNICKYSLPSTRVYLSLEKNDGQAIISFKNTSKDQLNISPEELLERFKRGDSSRNSEGNGLGLSIAKSLTELQNGTLDLSIDGDLFKITLSFPLR
ncbi:MAG: HAMP domain-containing histidine kinase [Erysipelotrichaceae bacterium]|nr:HAMP domain-containing histidine kinase [Erysipelotrichaceae bacterium]